MIDFYVDEDWYVLVLYIVVDMVCWFVDLVIKVVYDEMVDVFVVFCVWFV